MTDLSGWILIMKAAGKMLIILSPAIGAQFVVNWFINRSRS
jgi:hypothetical protein